MQAKLPSDSGRMHRDPGIQPLSMMARVDADEELMKMVTSTLHASVGHITSRVGKDTRKRWG